MKSNPTIGKPATVPPQVGRYYSAIPERRNLELLHHIFFI